MGGIDFALRVKIWGCVSSWMGELQTSDVLAHKNRPVNMFDSSSPLQSE